MNKKTLTIYLADPIHTYSGSKDTWFIPLSVLNIQSYIEEKFEDKIKVKSFKFPEKLIEAIDEEAPDIIGVSNYIWNFNLGISLIKYAKQKNKNCISVVGGPNATLTNEKMSKLLKSYPIDYYVADNIVGGEISFARIVESKLNGFSPIHKSGTLIGTWYRENNNTIFVKAENAEKTMDWLPSPFQKGLADEFFEEGLGCMIETNRGCPFHCTFCVWGAQDTNSKVTQFSVDRVIRDLEYIKKRVNHDLLMINDANFGLFKNRDLQIAKYIRKINKEDNWPQSIVVNWGQVRSEQSIQVADELKGITLLRQSSQSQNLDVLKNIKRENIPDYQWKYVAEECKKDGIESFSEVIIMLPGETIESYLEGLRYFFNLGIDCINSNQCQLLEGAEINDQNHRTKYKIKSKWRLLENAYGDYDKFSAIEAEEIIVQTNTFSFKDSLKCRMLNWLIQMSWTLKRHNLILKLLKEFEINPVDFLFKVIEDVRLAPTNIQKLFKQFETESKEELFDSYEELIEYYSQPDVMKSLRFGGFKKLNTYYSGHALKFNNDFISYYKLIAENLLAEKGLLSNKTKETINQICIFSQNRVVDDKCFDDISHGKSFEKHINLQYDILSWERDFEGKKLFSFEKKDNFKLKLFTSDKQTNAIKNYLNVLSRDDLDYRLQKLCEPYYGMRKEYLNYSCSSGM